MAQEERLKTALADRYRIERETGTGGMATVYIAEDLRHHRKVALKVLRAELAAIIGAERFLKEIEVTANLQHPNILPLYDSGEADGFLYYVMPLLEGETLREKLNREHQLQVEEAVEIARSVAAALDYAHRHDVIHRDIKPSNVLLHDGQAMLGDFGIALAMSRAGSGERLTETGLSLGTPHYMSPEQAAGDRKLDARSDLYALGAVTYEMLVGEPPHVAKTAQAVVAKILSDTPAPIGRTRELVPANVEAAVTRALARSPADRFKSAAEFSAALANPSFTLPAMAAAVTAPGGSRPARLWRALGLVAAGAVAAAFALWVWGWTHPPAPPPVTIHVLAFLPGQELVDQQYPSFAIARGAAAIVYVGPGAVAPQLWVKRRDRVSAEPLPGTEGAAAPSISPDGSEVVFWADGELRKVPLLGGAALTVTDGARPVGVAWMDDGTLIYSGSDYRLRRVPTAGGTPEEIWPEHPGSRGAIAPSPLPDSRGVFFTLCDPECATVMEVWVLDLRTGEAHAVVEEALGGGLDDLGNLSFLRRDGTLFSAPFDSDGLRLAGDPVPVLEGVKMVGSLPRLAGAPDGTLLFLLGSATPPGPPQEMVWVSRDGGVRPVDPDWRVATARNGGWALSPDGTRLAIGLNTGEGDDIWIKELDEGPRYPLTRHPAEDARPGWWPDGQSVYFVSRRRDNLGNLYLQRADGASDPVPFLVGDTQIWQAEVSPDGAWMLARVGGVRSEVGGRDIVGYHLEGDTTEVPLLASAFDEVSPTLSPDGRWLAYASQESGQWEVYVRPFPDVQSGKGMVSTGGGFAPMWAHSGREIFYLSPDDQMMAAEVETGEGFRVRGRNALFTIPVGTYVTRVGVPYDVSPDDQRFIMMRLYGAAEELESPSLVLVENRLQEVRARVEGEGG